MGDRVILLLRIDAALPSHDGAQQSRTKGIKQIATGSAESPAAVAEVFIGAHR